MPKMSCEIIQLVNNKMKTLPLLVLWFTLVSAKHEIYSGWKSYFVRLVSSEQLKLVRLLEDQYDLDFLSNPAKGRDVVILVKPGHQGGFTQSLKDNGISFSVHSLDIKADLDIDDLKIEKRKMETRSITYAKQMPYNNYQELEVIDEYVKDISLKYTNTVTLVKPANSFEGHPIQYLKISTTNFENHSKPVIFIDGGIHAREWISPPTVTWAIHKLVENVTEPDLLERFDWVILPVVNPDGYKHTFTDRFWRKTRSNNTHTLSSVCLGVDGNRNFDFYWNTVGTSSTPCSEIYAGNQSFSEIETRVVRDILYEHLKRISLYVTVHSYGSMIIYPWGNDGSFSKNHNNLHTVGLAMARTIDSYALSDFPEYMVGNSAVVLDYSASGAADDYAHSIGVPLAYTFELPGIGSSWDGFHLDPFYIQQICKETWEGVVVGARKSGELFFSEK